MVNRKELCKLEGQSIRKILIDLYLFLWYFSNKKMSELVYNAENDTISEQLTNTQSILIKIFYFFRLILKFCLSCKNLQEIILKVIGAKVVVSKVIMENV